MNYWGYVLLITLSVLIISALIEYWIDKARKISFNYKRLTFIMAIVYGIVILCTPYLPYSTMILFLGAPAITLFCWISEKVTRKSVSFELNFKIFICYLLAVAILYLFIPYGQDATLNLVIYIVLWFILFGRRIARDSMSRVLTLTKKLTKIRLKAHKAEKPVGHDNKTGSLNVSSTLMITIMSGISAIFIGALIYVVINNRTPKTYGKYIFFILAISISIVSLVLILTIKSDRVKKVGIALSFFALMLLGLGVNYSSRIEKANQRFKELSEAFNFSYKVLKTGESVKELGEEIDNDPLVQEAEEDDDIDDTDYENDEDDDELNDKIIHDMKKELKEMKKNDTGKYDISRYEEKLDDLE